MVQLAEPEAPATIDASINYYLDNGEKPYTYTGGPGSTDLRSSTTADPHRVAMHNGRPFVDRFALERTASTSCLTTPRCRAFSKRTKSAASTIRRWKRW
jgi:hypothetical protein